MMDNQRQMMSIKELADMLNVSQKTIRRHINSGKIKSVKLGGVHRISREGVSALLDGEKLIENEAFPFPSKVPAGTLNSKWSSHKGKINLVSPANKRNIDVIVVGLSLIHI